MKVLNIGKCLIAQLSNVGFAVATGKLSAKIPCWLWKCLEALIGWSCAQQNSNPPAVAQGSRTATTNIQPQPVVAQPNVSAAKNSRDYITCNLLGASIIKPLIDSHSFVSCLLGQF